MSVTADLIDFAEHAGAQVRIWRGNGVGITWDCGRYWYHIWDKVGTHPQALYGETEYLEPRVPTMLSDYGEIMLRWAIVRNVNTRPTQFSSCTLPDPNNRPAKHNLTVVGEHRRDSRL